MSKLVRYISTTCFLMLLIVIWGCNIIYNIEVSHLREGTLNISVEYVGTDKVEGKSIMISNLQKGNYEIAMGSLADDCYMVGESQFVQVDPKNAAFASLQMKCNDSFSSVNQVFIVYDTLRHAEVYVADSGSALTKVKAENVSDPVSQQATTQRKVIFSMGGNIWSYDISQKRLRQLTDNGFNSDPNWSPRGSQIAFTKRRAGNTEVYVMDADGSNQQNMSNSKYLDTAPDWSPCGMKLVFTSNRDGDNELFMVYPNTQRIRQLTDNTINEKYALWSSDGRELLVMSESWMGFKQIHKIDFNGRILKSDIVFGAYPANTFNALWTTTGYHRYVSSLLSG